MAHKRTYRALALACVALVTLLPLGTIPAGAGERVTVSQQTFTDRSRATPARGDQPATDERVLETTIAYPAGAKRRLPLVVLAHGYNGNPGKFTQLIGAWASAGYVVAAPQFPATNDRTSRNGPTGDVVNQPGDVSFVIDRMLAQNKRRGSELRGRIDPKHIGLAGLSVGGWTTYGTVLNSCCRDDRIDAAIMMSAIHGDFAGGAYEYRSVPILLVHSDGDPLYVQSLGAYPLLAAPKWFVTLPGGTPLRHASPFEDSPDDADQVVRDVTTAFWDLTLKGRKAAEQRLEDAAQPADGLATLQHEG